MSEAVCTNPDVERWNRRYANPVVCTRDPETGAEPELLAHHRLLDGKGIALEVAAGRGDNALYLASVGYRVVACDLAINGLSPCAAFAQRHALPVHCMVCDLDSYRFPSEAFDMVSVVRYLNRPIFPELVDWLKPRGLLFYKTFNRNVLKDRSGFNPGYVLEPGELDTAFAEMEILASGRGRAEPMPEVSKTSYILARKR